jgi:hypothetical protein
MFTAEPAIPCDASETGSPLSMRICRFRYNRRVQQMSEEQRASDVVVSDSEHPASGWVTWRENDMWFKTHVICK